MRYYIIAGEKSGDIYAGQLIEALKHVDQEATFEGIGGSCMAQAGAKLNINHKELSIIGVGFLFKIWKFYGYFKKCKKKIKQFCPDALILIDYAGFNLRIAKFAKKQNIKIFYYISPKIWAWNRNRIHVIKAYVDHLFCIFNFEKDFYAYHQYYNVDYVGHPLVKLVRNYEPPVNFLSTYALDTKRPIIALLPGSRFQEIKRILPKMLAMATHCSDYQFAIAAVSEMPQTLYQFAEGVDNVCLVYDQLYGLLSYATAAVTASGTATLEVALFNVPQVVVYQVDWLTYKLAQCLLKIPFISLVNILAQQVLVRELIQHELTLPNLVKALDEITSNTPFKAKQLLGYQQFIQSLETVSTAHQVAQRIVQLSNNL